MTSLGEALPREMARLLRDVLPAYIEIGPRGALAVACMFEALAEAADAIAEQNIAGMMIALDALRAFPPLVPEGNG